MIRYVGIDPGSCTALVILTESGGLLSVHTVNKPGHSRAHPETWQQWGIALRSLHRLLTDRLEPGDSVVILANPINRSAIVSYGQTLGVVRQVAVWKECALTEVRDTRVKALMVGHGGATKEEMIAKASELWPGVEWNEHTADAALAAECVRRGE